MAKAATLNIDVIANVQNALNAFQTLRAKAGDHMSTLKAVGAAAGVAIAAELGVATRAAIEDEQHTAKLEQAYRNLGLSTAGVGSALEKIDASARRTGISADESKEAYARLVTATHDTGKAMTELATAQDLAAYKGVSVESAANAIIRASQGSTRELKALGIATTDAGGHALSSAEMMDKLTAAVHGQADAFGDTAAGKAARYKESMQQLQETIGGVVLPVLSKLLDMLMPIFDWMAKNEGIVHLLVTVLGVLGGAIVVIIQAMKVWTAVQTAFNIVMDANPIGLVIIAVAALVAGVIWAYKNVGWFRDAVNWLWRALSDMGAWIAAHWQLIIGIMLGPLGFLIFNFDKVKAAIQAIIDALLKVKDAAADAFGWLGKIASAPGNAIGWLGSHLPFGLAAGGAGPMPAPTLIAIYATPGNDFPEQVYDALRRYQRRHVRPELAAAFGGR